MNLPAFALLYLIIGAGCAVAVAMWRSGGVVDAALMVVAWPLYGPIWLSQRSEAPAPRVEEPSLLAALRLARGEALAELLPDEAAAQRLVAGIEAVVERAEEIDRLLADPELNRSALEARITTLEARGQAGAARAARATLNNIHRLEGLSHQAHEALEELAELMRHLRTQAEIVRLSGGALTAVGPLAQGLMDRVAGLEAVLADEAVGVQSVPSAATVAAASA